MINLQKEFLDFHNNIKLDDENEVLIEKRDILLNILSKRISADAASFTHFNQGSYAMHTGIKPKDNDYDIDVGLKFDIDKKDFDLVEVKKWVKDALDGHTKSVEIRRSCVTVTYQKNDESLYHVDFAVYAANNSDGKMYIAKGKEYSDPDKKIWEVSCPMELMDTLRNRFDNADDGAQFRRVVRYMKKWKDTNFTSNGNSAPTGISLTVLAYNLFNPEKSFDNITLKTTYDDFIALSNLVRDVLNSFSYTYRNGELCHAISAQLPVEPYNELFEKMTNRQMESFYDKVRDFDSVFAEAKKCTKRSEACNKLVEVFGDDFPITVDKSTVGTSESA